MIVIIDVEGAVVTGDAAHCNRETAQAIVDRNADWLLKLKGNRAAAHKRAVTFFTEARAQGLGRDRLRSACLI